MSPVAGVGISVSFHGLPFLAPSLSNILYNGGIPALMVGSMTKRHPAPDNEFAVSPDVVAIGAPNILLNGVIFCPYMGSIAHHRGAAPTAIMTGIPNILIGF